MTDTKKYMTLSQAKEKYRVNQVFNYKQLELAKRKAIAMFQFFGDMDCYKIVRDTEKNLYCVITYSKK